MAPTAKTIPKLPKFSPKEQDPEAWFNLTNVIFEAFNVTDDKQRFALALTEISKQGDLPFSDLTSDAPEEDRFDWLKVEVTRRLGITRESRMMQLLKGEERGDRRPSEYVRSLKNKAPQSILRDTQIKMALINSMPADCQRYLQPFIQDPDEKALDQMVRHAEVFYDNPIGISAVQQPTTSASSSSPSVSQNAPVEFASKNEVMAMIANALKPQSEPNRRPRQFNRANNRQNYNRARNYTNSNNKNTKRSAESDDITHTADGICKFHHRFGESARKCIDPCTFAQKN